jgi:hypothetical protein
MSSLEFVILIVGILIAWMWIYWQRSEALLKKYGAQAHFSVGRYLVGLDDCNYVTNNVECVVAPTYFAFAKMNGQELGRMPRDSIEEVAFDDKSQLAQRLTATRMLALGAFALAAPKTRKIKEWCVAVRWVEGKGLKRTTVFEFSGSNPEGEANKAANLMMKYIQRRPQQAEAMKPLQADVTDETKTCPFCAETIKAAAVLCRFCNRELPK